MTTPSKAKASVVARLTTLVTGIAKHITGNVTLDGVSYTPVTLAAVFSAAIAAIQLADSQYTQWLDDVKAQKAAQAVANALLPGRASAVP